MSRYAHRYVNLRVEQKEDQVLVIFENDTHKLSEEDIPDLFRQFYRKEFSRRQGGSGLGLTITKSLAEEMGGSLEARVEKMRKRLYRWLYHGLFYSVSAFVEAPA
ncbi:MAG: sensor histidine kinase [Roseburia sp.]|nr:sensor histidine kinase [Roseburia sp.]